MPGAIEGFRGAAEAEVELGEAPAAGEVEQAETVGGFETGDGGGDLTACEGEFGMQAPEFRAGGVLLEEVLEEGFGLLDTFLCDQNAGETLAGKRVVGKGKGKAEGLLGKGEVAGGFRGKSESLMQAGLAWGGIEAASEGGQCAGGPVGSQAGTGMGEDEVGIAWNFSEAGLVSFHGLQPFAGGGELVADPARKEGVAVCRSHGGGL